MKKSISQKVTMLLIPALSLMTVVPTAVAQSAAEILLKNYRPVSIFNVPVTQVDRAAFPVIDIHSHAYAKNEEDLEKWIKTMDACGIEKTIILTQSSGAKFDSIYDLYSKYGKRFELWCGFDYTGYDEPGFGPAAVKELERCYKKGARGVGELGDKGRGLFYCKPVKAWGMHIDDPAMRPLFDKCAELNMPVNIHVGDPVWMYEKMDSTNDGLMNALTWRIDMSLPGIIDLDALVNTLENAVRDNPKTTFIACHFANLNHDLEKLSVLLDKYPNLYADISARFAESAPIPRYMKTFYEKYQDRLLYGTDMGYNADMYRITFRILETDDEHFYETDQFGYHWPLNGFGLSEEILKKVYHDNALKVLK
jgi:predicted TIM-barrel fold metal-dependent hydrolase